MIVTKGCSVRVSASFSLMFLAIALGLAPRAESAEPAAEAVAPELVKVGIMEGMFKGVPPALVNAAGTQFGSLFKAIVGLPGAAETEADYLALAKKLDENKVHLAVVHGFEWAWIQKKFPNLAPLALTVPSQLPQACVVVNAKESLAGPQALKGADIDIPFNMKAHGFVYVEKLEKDAPAGSFKVAPSDDASYEELLDAVGKGKSKAALVDAVDLASYQAGFPGKAAKIKVLCQSELMPQVVLIYNTKALPAKTVKQIQDGLLGAAKNPNGKVFLFMWKLKGFELPNAGFDALVAKSLAAFPPPEKK